jgi:hypothetical protein
MSSQAVFVFTGPTLPVDDARSLLDAVYLPPVSQGDVYRAARERPWGIGIIDGYFGRIPAVWHKEILWALSQGIHVFGAASMGALRAAELAPFGMEGVGEVFAAFRDGELTDDDEVAVVHGPAEAGYRPLSEAMVNIRATLDAAVVAEVVGEEVQRELLALAKAIFYPRRTWPGLLAEAASRVPRLAKSELAALAAWLPSGRVDRKQADARALLAHMAARREADPGPKQVSFRFQHTDAWEEARRQAALRPVDTCAGADTFPPDAVLDELRHAGRYEAEREGALARALALEVARLQGLALLPEDLEEGVDEFRRARGLAEPEALERFLAEQGLTPEGLFRLVRDEALAARVRALAAAEIPRHLHDRLRASGGYGGLAARSREKQAALAVRGLDNPALADCGLPLPELWRWYFAERLGRPVPEDLPGYARGLDLLGEEDLLRMVLREWQFCSPERQNR